MIACPNHDMTMSAEYRSSELYRFFAGLSRDWPAYAMPARAAPVPEHPPVLPGVLELKFPAEWDRSGNHIRRLIELAEAAPVNPAEHGFVQQAMALVELVNTGPGDTPVSGRLSALWRALYVLYRSDYFGGGGAFDLYMRGATRVANEIRRRQTAASDGASPWTDLPDTPPYVLPQDMAVLRGHGQLLDAGPRQLRFELLPGPFVGNPATASVVLLGLNPGFDERDLTDEKEPRLAAEIRHSLTLSAEARFHPIAPEFAAASGSQWWCRHLSHLIGPRAPEPLPVDVVMSRLANVEWFPYHSERFHRIPVVLPSQAFTFATVRDAVRRGSVVVLTRSADLWLTSVPELSGPSVIRLKNPQNPSISPGNMEPGEFERIVAALHD